MTKQRGQEDAFRLLCGAAGEAGSALFLVGGYVRDLLLGKPMADKDIDVVFEGDGIAFAKIVIEKTGGSLKTFPAFGTAKIVGPKSIPGVTEIDIASSRTEQYESPGALPKVSLAPLTADLSRRDFTINALALPLASLVASYERRDDGWRDSIIDTTGGLEDLEAKRVAVLHDRSFLDDPTRLYRAIRYRSRLGGSYAERTAVLFRGAVQSGALETVSVFRKFNECKKMLEETEAIACLREALHEGLLDFLLPRTEMISVLQSLEREIASDERFLAAILAKTASPRREALASELQIGRKKLRELTETRS